MPDQEDDDRRGAYRVNPDTYHEPALVIAGGGREAVPERVADINLRGTKLVFAAGEAPQAPPGREVLVRVNASELDGEVEITARTVFSANRGAHTVMGFLFVTLPEALSRADGSFFTTFNRRGNRREAGELSGTVAINPEGGDADALIVRIDNFSGTGIGFFVDEQSARVLETLDVLKLVVQFNESGEQRELAAEIVHRAESERGIYFGCRLINAP